MSEFTAPPELKHKEELRTEYLISKHKSPPMYASPTEEKRANDREYIKHVVREYKVKFAESCDRRCTYCYRTTGSIVTFSTTLLHPKDKYDALTGNTKAAENFALGRRVQLRIPRRYNQDASWFLGELARCFT